MPDRPIETLALPPKFHELFDGHITCKIEGDQELNERLFLSGAIAAYTLHKLVGTTYEEAAAIVDGGGDGFIDGVYFSPLNNTLWLVQDKYIHSGVNEADLGHATKFKDGVENMLRGKFEAFPGNYEFVALQPTIESWIANLSTQIRTVLCYSGVQLVSEDRKRRFESLKTTVNRTTAESYLGFQSVNLTTPNDWITDGDVVPGIESLALENLYPGYVTEPYELVYGLIPIDRLVISRCRK